MYNHNYLTEIIKLFDQSLTIDVQHTSPPQFKYYQEKMTDHWKELNSDKNKMASNYKKKVKY